MAFVKIFSTKTTFSAVRNMQFKEKNEHEVIVLIIYLMMLLRSMAKEMQSLVLSGICCVFDTHLSFNALHIERKIIFVP